MTATRGPAGGTIVAAVLLSAAAHAAVVLMGDVGEPLPVAATHGGAPRMAPTLRVGLRSATPQTVPIASTSAVAIAPAPARRAATASPARAVVPADAAPPGIETEAPGTERPVPLTYPVLELPSDDDPMRIGLVRLMLVVSSEGTVVRTVVVATTLAPDYVERIVRGFEQVRFSPARSRGLPRASWYEVVVNFDFDPAARTRL